MLENKVMCGKLGGNGAWSLGRRDKDKCRPSSAIDGGSHSTLKYGGDETLSSNNQPTISQKSAKMRLVHAT
jgi:hypothetical protein